MIELEGGDRNANNLASDTRVNIMEIKIRHVEPDDYKEIQKIYAQTKTVWGTLQLTVYVDNEPAINLYTKFGFKVEGRLEKYAFREGSYVDVYNMARIKSSN